MVRNGIRSGGVAVLGLLALLATASAKTPSSPAFTTPTAACIKDAVAAKKQCKLTAASADCAAEYKTAIGACFAGAKGGTCASACLTKKDSCDLKTANALKSCRTGCKTSADPTCKASCAQAKSDAKKQCDASLGSCLAKCPNLK